ncbi:MAG: hypothetical protein SVV03_03305 [Candidatus Nanohaloarchaea archaeon]|nr:hypothetical protein [Candidatus Nanohaloarchaea archaeon]
MPTENGIDTWMVFEVLAGGKETAEESLEKHVESIKNLESVEVSEADFEGVEEVENPHPSLDKGYSQICELECNVEDFPTLINLVMNYGPTIIEIHGPDKIELDLREAQDSLNLVSEMMQKFLQAGAGGMMISRSSEE